MTGAVPVPPTSPEPERRGAFVKRGLVIPPDEIQVRTTTSGGPGGQHANRSETRVDVAFYVMNSQTLSAEQRARVASRVGPIVRVSAGEERSQARNRSKAFERLGTKLANALHYDTKRLDTRPTKASVKRRIDAKKQQSTRKTNRKPPGLDD
jgi:ribosome-associated protein